MWTLWAKVPEVSQWPVVFHTDFYEVDNGVLPPERHQAMTKHARNTNHLERFNNTLRQRLSHLVRATLSLSKKLTHHIGAITYCICHNNVTRAAA
jgi:insertion element IS1 protein InsB